jgi:surfactin synthase thioesterase subunit
MKKQQPWFIPSSLNKTNSTNVRLFVFPHGGGSPAQYKYWCKMLSEKIDIYFASIPGRGTRFIEEPLQDIAHVVSHMNKEIKPLLGKYNVFFGHSLGALISYKLAKSLSDDGLEAPDELIISAKNAPHVINTNPLISNLDDNSFLNSLREYGGTPLEIIDNEELMELQLPMLRADFHMSENYIYRRSLPLPCKIHVFGAKNDPFTTEQGLKEWAQHSSYDEQKMQLFEGDHFYFHNEQEAFFSCLNTLLVERK